MFKSKLPILPELTIETPCPIADFEANAEQNEGGWFCHQCNQPVYSLAEMSRKEIGELYRRTGGEFCAAIARRSDGTMITNDPIAASGSKLAAGMLLASTALFASSAAADTEIGKVAQIPATAAPAPSPEPSGSEEKCDESKDEHKEATAKPEAAASPTPSGIRMLRGKVMVRPKDWKKD